MRRISCNSMSSSLLRSCGLSSRLQRAMACSSRQVEGRGYLCAFVTCFLAAVAITELSLTIIDKWARFSDPEHGEWQVGLWGHDSCSRWKCVEAGCPCVDELSKRESGWWRSFRAACTCSYSYLTSFSTSTSNPNQFCIRQSLSGRCLLPFSFISFFLLLRLSSKKAKQTW